MRQTGSLHSGLFKSEIPWSDELSADFNGSTSFGEAINDTHLASIENLVISFWIKTTWTYTGTVDRATICAKYAPFGDDNTGWSIHLRATADAANGTITITRQTSGATGEYRCTTAVNDGDWHHVAIYATSTAYTGVFRIDGGSPETVTTFFSAGGGDYINEEEFRIGNVRLGGEEWPIPGAGTPNWPFDGLLDEMAFVQYVSDDMFDELYNEGTPFDLRTASFAPQMVAYYWLGDADEAGTIFCRHGTVTGNLVNTDVAYVADVPP